jgi:transcription antitermination factor NusG
MERTLRLKFASLTYSDKDKTINREKKAIIKAFNYNQQFFKIRIPKFKIRLVYSRAEFDKIWGEKTEKFVSGFIRDGQIVVFSYSVFDKETKWEKKYFYGCLLHEISHLFYEELRNDSYDPLWLSEGLATFIQCGKKKLKHKKNLKITKSVLEEGFEKMNMESYHVYYLFVRYMIVNFSKKKLFRLVKGLKNGNKLEVLFKKIYKTPLEKLIKDANKHKKIA